MSDIDITEHRGFVANVANKYRRSGVDVDDLIQEGMIGLLEAEKRFDPEKGKFLTYAAYDVVRNIRVWALSNRSVVKPPRRMVQKRGFVPKSDRGIGERDKFDCAEGSSKFEGIELIDVLFDNLESNAEQRHDALKALECLRDNEYLVIVGLIEGRSLGEIGKSLGVTKQRAQQIGAAAVDRMRQALACDVDNREGSRGLRPYGKGREDDGEQVAAAE